MTRPTDYVAREARAADLVITAPVAKPCFLIPSEGSMPVIS